MKILRNPTATGYTVELSDREMKFLWEAIFEYREILTMTGTSFKDLKAFCTALSNKIGKTMNGEKK